jgi:hypothetical protein
VRDLVPDHPRIRLIHLEGKPVIGNKRNYGCQRAAGEIIAHWDDDDWSGPERLRTQAATLAETGSSVTGFRTMRFTDGEVWWNYTGAPDFVVGTSLMYRRAWWARCPFNSLQVGEDNAFVKAAADAGQLAAREAGGLMYATIHPGNTSPRTMGAAWTREN